MQRLVPFNGPTKDYGLQDILEGYITNSAIEDWKLYDVFEGVDPRKRQALAVVLLVRVRGFSECASQNFFLEFTRSPLIKYICRNK